MKVVHWTAQAVGMERAAARPGSFANSWDPGPYANCGAIRPKGGLTADPAGVTCALCKRTQAWRALPGGRP